MADSVALTDLQVIQRYSLAVRGANADRADLIEALRADLAWLQSSGRSAPQRPIVAVEDFPLDDGDEPDDDAGDDAGDEAGDEDGAVEDVEVARPAAKKTSARKAATKAPSTSAAKKTPVRRSSAAGSRKA